MQCSKTASRDRAVRFVLLAVDGDGMQAGAWGLQVPAVALSSGLGCKAADSVQSTAEGAVQDHGHEGEGCREKGTP